MGKCPASRNQDLTKLRKKTAEGGAQLARGIIAQATGPKFAVGGGGVRQGEEQPARWEETKGGTLMQAEPCRHWRFRENNPDESLSETAAGSPLLEALRKRKGPYIIGASPGQHTQLHTEGSNLQEHRDTSH